MQRKTHSTGFGRGYTKGNSKQQSHVGRSAYHGHDVHSHNQTTDATINRQYTTQNQNHWGQRGRSNTMPNYSLFGGKPQGDTEMPITYDEKSVCDLLKSEGMFYQPGYDKHTSDIDDVNDVQISLAEHTDIDNMDEDNKFICKKCTKNKGAYCVNYVYTCIL